MDTANIRVAFWHNTFAPYRVPLFQQLGAFDDIDLTVYYGSPKDRHRQWDVDFGSGYHHVLLPSLTIPGYPYKFNYTLFSELLRQRYDVHIASENELGCQLMFLAARYVKIPFIVWSEQIDYQIVRDHRDYTVRKILQKIGPFLVRLLQSIVFYPLHCGAVAVKRHCDAYLAAEKKTEEHLRNLGAPGPFFRHGSTIDTMRFQQELQAESPASIRQALGIDDKLVILSVSYLQERKGVQYLIDAFLGMQRPNTVLLIVGDGEYASELHARVPTSQTDVMFMGHDEKTAKYYAIADIFVMPSFSDPWGLTVNEAMVAGQPVITTCNVGAQELIRGNGFVIPPRDSRALQEALEQLVDDAALRQRMGQRSQEIMRAYTIEHTASVCRQAIHAVLQR